MVYFLLNINTFVIFLNLLVWLEPRKFIRPTLSWIWPSADATLFRRVIGQLQYLAFTKTFAVHIPVHASSLATTLATCQASHLKGYPGLYLRPLTLTAFSDGLEIWRIGPPLLHTFFIWVAMLFHRALVNKDQLLAPPQRLNIALSLQLLQRFVGYFLYSLSSVIQPTSHQQFSVTMWAFPALPICLNTEAWKQVRAGCQSTRTLPSERLGGIHLWIGLDWDEFWLGKPVRTGDS